LIGLREEPNARDIGLGGRGKQQPDERGPIVVEQDAREFGIDLGFDRRPPIRRQLEIRETEVAFEALIEAHALVVVLGEDELQGILERLTVFVPDKIGRFERFDALGHGNGDPGIAGHANETEERPFHSGRFSLAMPGPRSGALGRARANVLA
jgi:hypothetical protein